MMQRVCFPDTDLSVSSFCFGGGPLGTTLGGEAADSLLADFLTAGGNFFDTAHCYEFWKPNGLGASERELGAALRRLGALGTAVIATKGGHPDGGPDYRRPAHFLAPELLAKDVSESLERLHIPRIDLYYLHRDDGKTPVGEIMEALNGFVRGGQVRYLGASNWSVARLREANDHARRHGLAPFIAAQVGGSLAIPNHDATEPDPTVRSLDEEQRAFFRETGLPVVAYSATASGYFSGKTGLPALYDSETNAARRERARALAARRRATPVQIAVAYLRSLPGLQVIPLFGTTRREHLREVLDTAPLTLSEAEVRFLETGKTA